MQEFVLKTRLCFGAQALETLKTLAYRKLFIVTDRFFVENKTAQRLSALCPQAQVCIFDRVQPDPPLSLVAQGVQQLQAFQPDVILALGGGSAIDCAKGILAMSASGADLIAIPTTSGTGSDVTGFAILTHDGVKHPLIDERIRPDLAILDDSLLHALPKTLIADAGMDVAAHCLEAIASKNASPFSDALAAHALQIIFEKLPRSYQGDTCVRGEIHCAATMAGIAFDNAGLGVCHALSHALGGMFHLAHGRLNGILLPAVIRFNNAPAYTLLAKRCGVSGIRGLIFAVERLRRTLQLPESLTQAGLQRSDVLTKTDAICTVALNDPCISTNPKNLTKEDLGKIVREVL